MAGTVERRLRPGTYGRPRRYRAHEDRGYTVESTDTVDRVLGWVEGTASDAVRAKFADRKGLISRYEWFKVGAITFNDPRCCWMVVDAVLYSEPMTYLRVPEMAVHLQQRYPGWYWDLTVLGRIVAGIRAVCEEVYINDHRYINDRGDLPFAGTRDARGQFYVVDPKGGNEGRLWLLKLRQALFERSSLQQWADTMGDFRKYHAHDVNAGWMVEIAPDPIRSREAYEAQLTGAYAEPEDVQAPGVLRPAPDLRRVAAGLPKAMEGFVPAGGTRTVG